MREQNGLSPARDHFSKTGPGQTQANLKANTVFCRFAARNRYHGCHKMDCSELGIARGLSWQGPYVLDAQPVCTGALCKNGTIPDWRV